LTGFEVARGFGLFGVEGGADLLDVSAVGADGFVELVAGDVELFGPEGDVGGHFGVDLFGIVGALGVFFVKGVGFVAYEYFASITKSKRNKISTLHLSARVSTNLSRKE
jgi:hypothetical protein